MPCHLSSGPESKPWTLALEKYIHILWDPLCYYQNQWELSHWLLQEHDRTITYCLIQVDIWLQNVSSFLIIPLQFSTVLVVVQIFQLLLMEHTGFLQERPRLKEFKRMTHFKFASNFNWITRAYLSTSKVCAWVPEHRDSAELQLHILMVDKHLKLFFLLL